MDWKLLLFGRTDERGRVIRDAWTDYNDTRYADFRRFARNGDRRIEAAGSLPDHVRRSAEPQPLAQTARDALQEVQRRRERGFAAPRVPFSAATGDDVRPFGTDFADWNAAVEAAQHPPIPEYLTEAPPPTEPETNPGRTPSIANNIPLGVEGGTRQIPTRLEHGANDHAPTREMTFGPLPSAQRPFDSDVEWRAARARAEARLREGRPTAGDRLVAMLFGNGRRVDQLQQETNQMRDEIRQR